MTDKELSDFIEHGANHFMEFALVFGDGWAGQAIQIAKELRTRLAQPEPEPVAWLCWEDKENNLLADTVLSDKACTECFPVYTAPPKKEWVGLTNDEQLEAIWESGKDGLTGDRYDVARAIEAKLKEKNNE